MRVVNKVILVWTLGIDPELRTTTSGQQVCNFSVATSEKVKGEERTEWHRITAFGKTAEFAAQYLSKGAKVYVDGKIQSSQYQKDGVTHTSFGILANNIQALEFKKSDDNAASDFAGGSDSLADEDIPF